MKPHAIWTLPTVAMIALTSLGCEDKWESGESWGPAVWAADESGVAIIKYEFERKVGANTPVFRNFQSRILTSRTIGGERTPIGQAFSGRIEQINYQRQAGYVLVEHVPVTSQDGDERLTRYAVSKVALDGATSVVAEHTVRSNYPCNGRRYVHEYPLALKVFPNTSGTQLGISRAMYDCDVPFVEVELRDAETGARLGDVMFVDVPDESRQAYNDGDTRNIAINHVVAWNARNRFLGTFQRVNDGGTLDHPLNLFNYQNVGIGSVSMFTEDNGQLAVPNLPASCFALPARSSANSPDGDLLEVNSQSGQVAIAVGPVDLRCR
ncbi:MAG: hypothetical protein VX589_02080 [Myxococcota bacterium]|nr:hypothetical protein [Myxococcota bacterium]